MGGFEYVILNTTPEEKNFHEYYKRKVTKYDSFLPNDPTQIFRSLWDIDLADFVIVGSRLWIKSTNENYHPVIMNIDPTLTDLIKAAQYADMMNDEELFMSLSDDIGEILDYKNDIDID